MVFRDQESVSALDWGPIYAALIGAAAGLAGLFKGLKTYESEQKSKRKDVIFPLLEEFDKSKEMEYAKNILDGRNLNPEQGWKYPKGYYNRNDLAIILRDSKPTFGIDDLGEVAIRHSFDALLDFFCKLEYLLNINLVRVEEIEYFRYYLDIAAGEASIVKYVKYGKFPLEFKRLSPDVTVNDSNTKPEDKTPIFTKVEDQYLYDISKNEYLKPYMVGYNLGLSHTNLEEHELVKQRPPPFILGDSSTLELTDSGKEFISHRKSPTTNDPNLP
jgi:hypothetical protein